MYFISKGDNSYQFELFLDALISAQNKKQKNSKQRYSLDQLYW